MAGYGIEYPNNRVILVLNFLILIVVLCKMSLLLEKTY